MQVLTIVVQSTVSYHDLGVATSGVTFFRTLGSSFGAAVFGTVYANVLSDRLPAAVAASPGVNPAAVTNPQALHAYPPQQITAIVEAYAHAMHVVFLAAIPVTLLAFVVALFLKQVPLRGTARETARDVGEGFCVPEAADADQQLQAAVARVVRHKGKTELPKVRAAAGVEFDERDTWTVGQVHLHTRLHQPATIPEIARLHHIPAPVLEPAFDRTAANGYLTMQDGHLLITPAGQQQLDRSVASLHTWLTTELSDWDLSDPDLERALNELATRFVDRDPEQVAERVGLFASAG